MTTTHLSTVFDERERAATVAWRHVRALPLGPERDELVRAIGQSEAMIAEARGRGEGPLLEAIEASLHLVRAIRKKADAVRLQGAS